MQTTRSSEPTPRPAIGLRRILGVPTIICTGAGCAIGSGIFQVPGEIATVVHSPAIILLLWIAAGVITLLQSIVTAELATRWPEAGGEYRYLREAYGEFAAFFFGWAFTIFIIGGSGGSIAAVLGHAAAALLHLDERSAVPLIGCGAIVAVVAVNCAGLRTGAVTQNIMTILKVGAVLGVAIGAMVITGRWTPAEPTSTQGAAPLTFGAMVSALLAAFWPYTGATDPAKLAGETRDVHHAMPRALIGTVVLLTLIYTLYNYALLCGMSAADMAGRSDVHAVIFRSTGAHWAEPVILVAAILICLSALSSAFLANTRVTYAMAQDGLTFRALGRMSSRQAPVGSLLLCGVIACAFVLNRGFSEILRIYFMGSTVLFGMVYLSLIIFRVRDRRAGRPFPSSAFKAPMGMVMAGLLVVFEAAIAFGLLASDMNTWSQAPEHRTYDTLLSVGLLAALAVCYFVWTRLTRTARTRILS